MLQHFRKTSLFIREYYCFPSKDCFIGYFISGFIFFRPGWSQNPFWLEDPYELEKAGLSTAAAPKKKLLTKKTTEVVPKKRKAACSGGPKVKTPKPSTSASSIELFGSETEAEDDIPSTQPESHEVSYIYYYFYKAQLDVLSTRMLVNRTANRFLD